MKATIIGGGVIGGGWAARFLLNGWDVAIFDPDPEAERKVGEVLANARAALPKLYDKALPAEGTLIFYDELADALIDTTWIQESVPERLEIKHKVYADIGPLAEEVILASSTSGFKPSELNEQGAKAIVAHPFNPVYLLPLVELVGDTATTRRAAKILKSIGMFPLTVRKEIDAHIADRFLEAVWREALWLINDGVATTEEIDDAIRMGFGLRWGQMGLFETYRVAGGEAGMQHFIAQFGPALQWPWTKLMDVPELSDKLINTIATQSDKQSGMYSIRELEQHRDENLIGFMRHLKSQDWGAGKVIAKHEATLPDSKVVFKNKQIITMKGNVLPSWIDYNGHMTEFRYGQLFADGADAFIIMAGLDTVKLSQGGSYFTAETHITFKGELQLAEPYYVTARVVSFDEKRLHLFQSLFNEQGEVMAMGEHMLLYVDAKSRRVASAPSSILDKLSSLANINEGEELPKEVGKVGR